MRMMNTGRIIRPQVCLLNVRGFIGLSSDVGVRKSSHTYAQFRLLLTQQAADFCRERNWEPCSERLQEIAVDFGMDGVRRGDRGGSDQGTQLLRFGQV